jgi:hypothetical protein
MGYIKAKEVHFLQIFQPRGRIDVAGDNGQVGVKRRGTLIFALGLSHGLGFAELAYTFGIALCS